MRYICHMYLKYKILLIFFAHMAVRKILPVVLNHILNDTSSFSSSSSFLSLSDSEDEVILHDSQMLNILVNELHDKVMRRVKIDNYIEGVIPGYSKHVFKEHFR